MGASVFDFDAPLPRLLYWDASFLVHATYPAGRYHRACYAFLERLCTASDTVSCISTLALDETIFALLRLKVEENHPNVGFWDLYRQDPTVIRPHLGELRALVDRLTVDPRIQLLGMDRTLCPPRWTIWMAWLSSLRRPAPDNDEPLRGGRYCDHRR